MKKFGPRSRVGIFRNERNRSTPLDSKLMFWCVLYYLDAFVAAWLPYKTRCKTGWSGAKVRAMKSCRNFSQRTHLIHPIGPLPHVSVHFVLFSCIWDSLLHYNTQFKMGQTCAKVRATKSRRNFFATNTPDPPHWTLNWCFGAFQTIWVHSQPFGCLAKLGTKRAELVPKFVPQRWTFSQRTHPIHPIGPKTDILVHVKIFGCIRDRLVA